MYYAAMHSKCSTLTLFISIPLYVALGLASLLPFQILQDTCIGTEGEVVVLPASKRRKAGRHVETVQVARNSQRGLGDLFSLKRIS